MKKSIVLIALVCVMVFAFASLPWRTTHRSSTSTGKQALA